jgi:hypothetical protein
MIYLKTSFRSFLWKLWESKRKTFQLPKLCPSGPTVGRNNLFDLVFWFYLWACALICECPSLTAFIHSETTWQKTYDWIGCNISIFVRFPAVSWEDYSLNSPECIHRNNYSDLQFFKTHISMYNSLPRCGRWVGYCPPCRIWYLQSPHFYIRIVAMQNLLALLVSLIVRQAIQTKLSKTYGVKPR